MKTNFHTHSTFCDGKNTPEAMCEAALARGFVKLGFSSHSDMVTDMPAYLARIRNLRELYRGRLEVFAGVEMELAKPWVNGNYDYVIGSVHFVAAPNGELFPVDHSPEKLADAIRRGFGGDAQSLVKTYFAALRNTLDGAFHLVGHPDLVRKFNLKYPYFDESAAWYRGELEATADAIARSGKLVEVNTGAISRGWLDDAYPSAFFRDLLRTRGVRFVLSSDAHSVEGIDCAFDRFATAEHFVDLI